MRKPPFNQYEGRAIANLYLDIADAVIAGKKINKAQAIRDLQETVDRSRGSIEAKLMNFSAVLFDLGVWQAGTKVDCITAPYHHHAWRFKYFGYKPAPNYQREMKRWLLEALASRAEAMTSTDNLFLYWDQRDEYGHEPATAVIDELRRVTGGYYV